ncbi:MAG: glutathione S-transferase N-terminal domain-containing protein [Methylotenera sp.]|nr:glutathione S-transferase N-terminal domain-containing protein [Oligoflexia bacterium]
MLLGARANASGKPAEEVRRLSGLFQGHTLYHFQVSPYAWIVRRTLVKWGIPIPMRDILEDPAAWKELVTQGGKDQVPCLKIETPGAQTRWMYESRDIIAYLKQKSKQG